jgi:hypothetical protein
MNRQDSTEQIDNPSGDRLRGSFMVLAVEPPGGRLPPEGTFLLIVRILARKRGMG